MQYTRAQIESWRRRDVERDRPLTPQQKLDATMALFYMGCDMMRLGIRAQHPNASPHEVNHILRERIEKSRGSRAE